MTVVSSTVTFPTVPCWGDPIGEPQPTPGVALIKSSTLMPWRRRQRQGVIDGMFGTSGRDRTQVHRLQQNTEFSDFYFWEFLSRFVSSETPPGPKGFAAKHPRKPWRETWSSAPEIHSPVHSAGLPSSAGPVMIGSKRVRPEGILPGKEQ